MPPPWKIWRHRTGEIVLDRTQVMGVLNVTPDSFSDGGRYFAPDVATRHGLEMVKEGADLLDVGGESTRPGSDPVSPDEEWRRVGSVIRALGSKVQVPISIDTVKPDVAAKAMEAGASIVNDVSGLQDPAMMRLVARTRAGVVAMHMLGNPKTMQDQPRYQDVVGELRSFFANRIQALESAGVASEAIAIDPGVGFGKTLDHNLAILGNLHELVALGHPVVVGVSRKSFIERIAGAGADDRLPGSLAAAVLAVAKGAHVVRAHDVRATVQATRVADRIVRGESFNPRNDSYRNGNAQGHRVDPR
jgi:dihydropteroate synthase